jgi:hypothetical protein
MNEKETSKLNKNENGKFWIFKRNVFEFGNFEIKRMSITR